MILDFSVEGKHFYTEVKSERLLSLYLHYSDLPSASLTPSLEV